MTTSDSIIRSEQHFAVTCAALLFGPLFMVGPAVAGVAIAIASGFDLLSLALLPVLVAGSVFFAYHMTQSCHWVELHGRSLRWQRFWTRRQIERDIAQICEIVPLGAAVKSIHTVVADKLLGTVRGYEIRFQGERLTIGLIRSDMTNVDALITELTARLGLEAAVRPGATS